MAKSQSNKRKVDFDKINEILDVQKYLEEQNRRAAISVDTANAAPAIPTGAALDMPSATKGVSRNLPQMTGGTAKTGGEAAVTAANRIANTPDVTADQMRRQALEAANTGSVKASRMQLLSDDQRRQRATEQIQRPRVAAQQAAATSADDKRRAAYEWERARQQAERNRVRYDPNSQYADIYAQYADVQENDNGNALSRAIQNDDNASARYDEVSRTVSALEAERRSVMNAMMGQRDPQQYAALSERLSQIDYQLEMLAPEYDRLKSEQGRRKAAYNARIRTEEYTRDEANAARFEDVRKNADFEALAADAMTEKEGYNPFVDNPAFYAAQLIAETGEIPNGSGSAYLYMTDDEAKTYSYYIAQGDRVKADNYFSAIKHRLNERMATAQYANLYEWSKDHPWLAGVASVGANLGSFAGYAAGVGQNIENAMTGIDRPIDTNSTAFLPVRATQTMREGINSEIESPLGQAAASIGLSIADTAANMIMYGPSGSGATLTGVFGRAAGSATYEASERGLSAGQSTAIGTAAGVAEVLMEKIPIDNLFNLAKGPVSLISREGIWEILKQAGLEFTEEMLTEYANTLTDISIAGDQSQYALYVQQLIDSGMTPEEAEHQANIQFFIVQPVEAGAAGAVSGGVMGGGAMVIGGNIVSPRVQQAIESATAEQEMAVRLAAQTNRTQAEEVALAVLEGRNPTQSELLAIRADRGARERFKELTGIDLTGDASTVTARVAAAAKSNAGNVDVVNNIMQMAAEDAQAAQGQAQRTSAVGDVLRAAADTQAGTIEQAQPESVYAPAQPSAPAASSGFFSGYMTDNTVPGGENAVDNVLATAANTLNEGQTYTVGEGNNYSDVDMSKDVRTALNRAEAALSGLGVSVDVSARTASDVYTQTAAQLAEYVDEHSGFAELKQYADESGVPVEELIRTALKENKVTIGGEAGAQLDRLVPGDLDSTRNKLAGAKADLDYALAQRNSYGNVRYGGTRKTRAQYEKWSAEVRRAQAEVTRLENELKTERGGEIRYLAKKNDSGYNDNQGGEINGEDNSDTGVLERREISAADRSGDGIWEQSENTRKISTFVEDVSVRKHSSDKGRIRAGDSGWLVRQTEQKGEIRDRFEKSVRGKISQIKPSGRDTVGRIINSNTSEKFKNTVFKDDSGNLLSLYHWTKEVFEEFAKGEFGFHFGTLDAAHDRFLQTKEEYPDTPIGYYKEVYLNIQNPYYVPFDAGMWCAHAIAYQLVEDGIMPERQFDRLAMVPGFYDGTYDNPAAVAVRDYLKEKGYDGVFYENESEDSGGISIIALYPDQIITVAENGVLVPGNGVSEPDSPRYLAAKKPQESAAPDLRQQTAETITIKTRDGKATVNAVSVMDTLAQIEMDDKRNGTDNLRTATAEIRRIQQMQKAFGLKVVFCDGTITFAKKSMGTQTFDGGMWHNGVVYINTANIGQSSVFVAAHELGHEISENDPELLREFHDLCLEYAKHTGKEAEFEAALSKIYHEQRIGSDSQALISEYFSNQLGKLWGNEDFVAWATGNKPTVWQRIAAAVRRFVDRLRNGGFTREARYFEEQEAYILKKLDDYRVSHGGESTLSNRTKRLAARAQQRADSLNGKYVMRSAQDIEHEGFDEDVDAVNKTVSQMPKRLPQENTEYGFRKITVGGLKHTVFAVNPDMKISTKRNIQAPYANTVAAARELAAVFGYKIGFVAGNTIVEDRNGAERAFPYDSVLADDGTIYINLNAKRPYTSIVGTMFWTQLKRENPKVANEITRAMRRIKNLRPGAEISGEDLVMSLFGRNTSALKGTTDGAKAVVLNPGELIERLSVDPNLARALEHEAPSAARRMVEAIGDALTRTKNKSERATRVLRQAQARVLKAFSEQAETAREMEQGAPVPKAQARQKTPGDVQYMSIKYTKKMPWQTQVEAFFDKSSEKNVLKSSDTLYILSSDNVMPKGLNPAALVLPRSVITKAIKGKDAWHRISENNIQRLKHGIENAYAYFVNPARNAIGIITNLSQEGYPVVVTAEMNVDLNGENVHRVSSIHLRQNLGGMLASLPENATVYVKNKNKLNSLLSGNEVKPSKLLASVEFIDSIPRFLAKVNQTPASQVAAQPQTAPPKLTESLFRKQYMLGMREGRAEVRDTYKRRDLRDGIKGRVKKINKALLTPTDISHVPERLQGAIANFLKEFTGDTSVFTRTQLIYLKDAYNRINETAEDAEYGVSYAYDPEIADMIGELADTIDGRRLSELSYEETQKVSDIVKHFQHLVRDENKIEIQGKRERVEKLGLSIMRDMDKLPAAGDSRLRGSAKAFADMLASDNITPAYFFKRLGGTVETLFKSMRDGQNVWARRMDSARKTYEDIYKRHHAKAWLDKKGDTFEMKTERGEDISLTRQQALTLYATWKREVTNRVQDAGHLSMGGFVYENAVSRKKGQVSVDTTRAHPLSANDMGKIMAWLTDEQRAFADELVAYMSGELAQYGNEASVQLHGWEKFNEKYYFPYNSASNYLYSQSAVTDDTRLKHMSFTKATVRKANNPIILSDFTSVWANHVQSMMMYSSLAVPLENFNRVFNFRTPASETVSSSSVKESIERAYGKRANTYIKQLMKDINGGVQSNPSEGLLNSLLSKFKKSAVFASASVVVQQPSSIVRAMAMVDPKYFVPTTTPMRSYEECMKYCGTAIIKRMGRFDTNTGRGAAEWLIARPYEKISEKAAAVVTDSSYRDEALSAAASKADEISWGFLWNAVKREQVKEHGYKPGSPELLKAAAERFDEVVNFTQVYDSVFARSQMMRSQGLGAKITTNFMSEPTVAYNMLFDAFVNAKRSDVKNKVSPQRAVAAFVATGFVNSLLKSIVTAARDDDEDKTYWEKYLGDLAGNFADSVNLLGLVPLARDISSILQGYSVDNPFFELPERTVKAAQNMFDYLSGNSNKSGGDVIWPLVEAIADWFGVPVKNIRRDIKAVFNVFKPGDTKTNWTGVLDSVLDALPMYDNTNSRNYQRLFDAYTDGNKQRMEQLVGILAENGVSESSIESGVRSVCRDKYIAGSVTQVEAEEFLAEFCGQTEDEAYWTIVSWDYRAEHPDYSGTWSDYTLLYDAIAEGDRQAIQQEIDRLIEHGKEPRNIKATITRKYGAGYLDDYDLE